jgi:hypothetical protein
MCIRSHNDSRSAWTLISLAVRIGHALDLHHDPIDLSFPPFETEMRRRLWWQINVLEIRASEDRGSPPMVLDYSTKLPSNVNDEDLSPTSAQEVTEHLSGTEMTFCLMCQEVTGVVRLLHDVSYRGARIVERKDREEMIKEIGERLESKYLAHCDPAIPIFWACSIVKHTMVLKGWLLLQYPYQTDRMATRSGASRDSILKTAVSILELANMLETNEFTAKWAWFFATYVQWHPLAVTLAELCVQTSGSLVERAWTIVDVVFDKWSDRIADNKKGSLWRPIKKLLGKARAARLQSTTRVEDHAVPVSEMQCLPTAGVGHAYTAPDSLRNGIAHDAIPAAGTEAFIRNEAALLYPQQQTGLDGYIPSDQFSDMNLDQPIDPNDWGAWDEFVESTWLAGEPDQENGKTQWTTQFGF